MRLAYLAKAIEPRIIPAIKLNSEQRLGDKLLVDHVLHGRSDRFWRDGVDRGPGEAQKPVAALSGGELRAHLLCELDGLLRDRDVPDCHRCEGGSATEEGERR